MKRRIRGYLPHLLLGVSISLIMVGAYMAVGMASSSAPKALWSTNPATITFSHTVGTGSITEFVKCAPKLTGVTFNIGSHSPAVSLSPSSPGEATCGPAPDTVTFTATSTTPGTYTIVVSILQAYSTVPPNLAVTIVVT